MKFILGSKLNMTEIFDASGKVVPVTVVHASPVKVVQVKKTDGKDRYNAVKIGKGRSLREFKLDEGENFETGQELTVGQFEVGDFVDVQGVMKGRGFTGPMKRYGFKGAPASHGHDHPRAVGSIGQRFPQHTLKGRRMAGRMGGHRVTVKNLEVIEVDPAKNLIAVKGAIPGMNGGLVRIVQSAKQKTKK